MSFESLHHFEISRRQAGDVEELFNFLVPFAFATGVITGGFLVVERILDFVLKKRGNKDKGE